jgi:hypothetical protein
MYKLIGPDGKRPWEMKGVVNTLQAWKAEKWQTGLLAQN